jgi:hypothetical protein
MPDELPNQYNSSLMHKLISDIPDKLVEICETNIKNAEINISTSKTKEYKEHDNKQDLNVYHFLSKLDEIHEESFIYKLKVSLNNKLQDSPNYTPAMLALAYLMLDNETFLDNLNAKQIYAKVLEKQPISLIYMLLGLSLLTQKLEHNVTEPSIRITNGETGKKIKYNASLLIQEALKQNTSTRAVCYLLLALDTTDKEKQNTYLEKVKQYAPQDLWMCNILINNKFSDIDNFIEYCQKYIQENPANIFKKIFKNKFKRGFHKQIDDKNNPYLLAQFQGVRNIDAKKASLAYSIYRNAKKGDSNYHLLDFSGKKLTELPLNFNTLNLRDGTTIDLSNNKFTNIPLELSLLQKPEFKDKHIKLKLMGNPLDYRAFVIANLFFNEDYLQDEEQKHQIMLPPFRKNRHKFR